jgi:hexosaminidase
LLLKAIFYLTLKTIRYELKIDITNQMKLKLKYLFCLLVIALSYHPSMALNHIKSPKRLKIGYSIGVASITPQKMQDTKSAGVDYLEVSLSSFLDKNRKFKFTDEEMMEKVIVAKKAADDAGVKIWSIHMPFSKDIDLSLTDESERRNVVALHTKILNYCKILKPEVILFHPSYFLGLNEREQRKKQLIKSAVELNKQVKAIKAIMVIENMLGYELNVGADRERPLCRTVEEVSEIMSRLPANIYAAVDMNHIKYPERLIRALGKRLKSVHIADGTGKKENHFFPCSGEGENNWVEILSALNEVGYDGPFMYESAYKDVKDFLPCYNTLYQNLLNSKASDSKL